MDEFTSVNDVFGQCMDVSVVVEILDTDSEINLQHNCKLFSDSTNWITTKLKDTKPCSKFYFNTIKNKTCILKHT